MNAPIDITPARVGDAGDIWSMVVDTGMVEENSAYAYLLLCDHFGATTHVARRSGELVGFVTAYRIPRRPDTCFVWQVGVSEAARGAGLATRLIDAAVNAGDDGGARWLEATVTEDNDASNRLFRRWAERRSCPWDLSEGYERALFPRPHEAERCYRIGPLRPNL